MTENWEDYLLNSATKGSHFELENQARLSLKFTKPTTTIAFRGIGMGYIIGETLGPVQARIRRVCRKAQALKKRRIPF
jgi:hypothetical protein